MKNQDNLSAVREIVNNERRMLKHNPRFVESTFRKKIHEIIKDNNLEGIHPEVIVVTSENMWTNVKQFKEKSYIIIDTTYLAPLLRLNNLYYILNNEDIHIEILLLEIIAKTFIADGDLFLAAALCKYHHTIYNEHALILASKNTSAKIQEDITITFVVCHELAHVLYKSKIDTDREKADDDILAQLNYLYSLYESNDSNTSQEHYGDFLLNVAKSIFSDISDLEKNTKDRILEIYMDNHKIIYESINNSKLHDDLSFIEECFCDRTAVDFMLQHTNPQNKNGMTAILIYTLNTIYNIQNLTHLKVSSSIYHKKDHKKYSSLHLKTGIRKLMIEKYILEKINKIYPEETESFTSKVSYLSAVQAAQSDTTTNFILYEAHTYCDEILNNRKENTSTYDAQSLYDIFEAYRLNSSII
ncbi:hypothetical protein [Flavobacterium sp.]|uniref:hypothetical protein n=1 Tax=Flavobacterium sp. TaxID=239 RepID=UPI0026227B94|nr:hypothetical protein [Flavobacterium sp.]